MVESLDVSHHGRLGGLDALSDLVDVLEEFWKLWQAIEERLDNDDSKLLSPTIPPKCLNDKLQRNVLEDPVQQIVFDDGSEKLGYLRQVLLRIPMQKPVLIEEAVKHARIYLLLLDLLRLLEGLHRPNELLNSLVDFMVLGREDPLEVLIGRRVDLLRVLSWLMVLREQLIRLGDQGRYPVESLAVDLVVLSEGRALQVLDGEDQLVLAQMRTLQDCVFVRLEAVKVLLLLLRSQLLRLVEGRVASGEVTNRSDDVFLDVLDEGIDEGRAHVFEAALDPHVVVKEVALASQNAEVDGEVVVLAVDDWDEAGTHFLGDVEHAGQVH